MWKRTYFVLVLIRLWFALSPSYLHPDENFQGPEVIAGLLPYPLSIGDSSPTFRDLRFLVAIPVARQREMDRAMGFG